MNYHRPVMLNECIEGLNIRPDGVYVDVTFGGGGHSRAIMEVLNECGRLYAFDQDADAMANAIEDSRFELIHENVTSIDIGESVEDLVVDSRILEECMKDEGKRNRTVIEIQKMLKLRLGNSKHKDSKEFKQLTEKLRELQERLRQQQIDSIQFLKDLLALAKEVLDAEQKLEQPQDKRKQARDALTELFESVRTPQTPIVVENVVNDIDSQVVDIVRRFNNAFKTVTGQNEVRKMLRTILWLKYKIKDNDVFEKAYKYVEMYY